MLTEPLTEPNQNVEIEFGAAARIYRSQQLKHTSETPHATCHCRTRRNGGARASNCSSKLVELFLSLFSTRPLLLFFLLHFEHRSKADCEPTGAPPGQSCSAESCAPPTKLGWWKRSFPLLQSPFHALIVIAFQTISCSLFEPVHFCPCKKNPNTLM